MKRTNQLIIGLAVMSVLTAIAWSLFSTGSAVPRGMASISQDVNALRNVIMGTVAAIGILVFAAMFISIFIYRRSRAFSAATFSHSTLGEVVWTAIPILIVVGTAIPATQVQVEINVPAWNRGASAETVNEAWTHVAQPGIHAAYCAGICDGNREFVPFVIDPVKPGIYVKWDADRRELTTDGNEDAAGTVRPARIRLYKGNRLER